MSHESMKGNKNAEKWTFEEADKFFQKALELSYDKEFDFIGEIARELKTYKEIFSFLVSKFPQFQEVHKTIISNCESNCFYNSKKGNINVAVGIVNLKSNHGWTDRTDHTTKDEKIQTVTVYQLPDNLRNNGIEEE